MRGRDGERRQSSSGGAWGEALCAEGGVGVCAEASKSFAYYAATYI